MVTTQDLWSMQFPAGAGTGYVVGSGVTILKTGFGGGVEEMMNDERGTMNAGATIVRGVLRLEVDSRQHAAYRAELLDVSGRKVLNLRPGPNNASRLAPGVYFEYGPDQAQHIHRVVLTK